MGVEGAGVAQLAASVVQVFVAFRLARLRPDPVAALSVLVRTLVCALFAFLPVLAAFGLGLPLVVPVLLVVPAAWLYLRAVRWSGVLSADERERLQQVGGRRMSMLAGWMP
jgi:hypothetical protein